MKISFFHLFLILCFLFDDSDSPKPSLRAISTAWHINTCIVGRAGNSNVIRIEVFGKRFRKMLLTQGLLYKSSALIRLNRL